MTPARTLGFRVCRIGLCAIAASACAPSGLGVVPRYPYVEDSGLALAHEQLNLRIRRDDSVQVEALFQFESRGRAKNRIATFPIGGPRGACRNFHAEVLGSASRSVRVARGEAGSLPVGKAAETWDLWLRAADFEAPRSWLAVRYVQPGTGDFGYVLKSGAYWHGPIRTLRVALHDPHARAAAMIVEGKRVANLGRPHTVIELRDIEPESGVQIEMR